MVRPSVGNVSHSFLAESLQDQKFQAVFCVGEFSAEEMDLEVYLVFTCLHSPFKASATLGNPGNDCVDYVVSM